MDSMMCPSCHAAVRPTDYFCFNCGKNLKPKPPSREPMALIGLFLGSVLLPPMGLWWGYKYIRHQDPTSRLIGLIAIVLTLVSLLLAALTAVSLMNSVNEQVNQAMPGLVGY